METHELRHIVMEMSDEECRRSLYALARQLDDGESPSIFNLVALIDETEFHYALSE